MSKQKNKGSKTSSFGSPGRISHDSSSFYDSRLYQGQSQSTQISYNEQPIPEEIQDKIFNKSSEAMEELPDHCVHLMITSPPYNVKKEYDQDLTLDEYRDLLRRVLQETYRVLVTGGRACVNVANLGRKPYLPLHAFIIEDILNIGFMMRGEIIWNKAASASA
ncbi:MAG: DNA methyltransferase, partial [Anaerolineales bacterium]